MTSPVINMTALSVWQNDKEILNIPSLQINQGELVAVLGRNGAGKSTLLQVINLLTAFQGHYSLFGEDTATARPITLRRRCSLAFQENHLLNMSVYDNLACVLKFHQTTERDIPGKVRQALAAFQAEHLMQRDAAQLSGGEAQRVCLARAVIAKPELLLLDEPSAALDMASRRDMIEMMRSFCNQHQITAILVSHIFTDVLNFADRALVIDNGRIVQDDSPEIIMRKPVNESIARLVAMDNLLPVSLNDQQLKLPGNILASHFSALSLNASLCCLPGDAIFLSHPSHHAEATDVITFDAKIKKVFPALGGLKLLLDVNGHEYYARLPRQAFSTRSLESTCHHFGFHYSDLHFLN